MPITILIVDDEEIVHKLIRVALMGLRDMVFLVAKDGAYVFRIDGDVARVNEVEPHRTELRDQHVEGCCFVPDGLLATSERRMIFLFTDPAFRRK